MPERNKRVNLALQGGGSHGAFTWGVLDTLLADRRITIDAISGTSAGALNAVALASGQSTAAARGQDGRTGARETLAQVWDDVSNWGALGELQAMIGRALWGGLEAQWKGSEAWAQALAGMVSPYESNPLGINPLRDLLHRRIDFEAIRRPGGPRVFVSATHVSTGKAVIFGGAHLTSDAVLASACLPTLFPAVEIDGQAYWDGGYSVNPAMNPLLRTPGEPDVIIVQINPIRREGVPRTAREILDRMSELTFNASLLTQVRAIDAINRLIAEGVVPAGRRKVVRLHRIDGGSQMLGYGASSKSRPDPTLIRELFQLGQDAAQHWLADHFDALGFCTTIDVEHDYLDDTRIALPMSPAPGQPSHESGFRPWLARLFRRTGTA